MRLAPRPLHPGSRSAERGRRPGGKRGGTECEQVLVEVGAARHDDGGGDARVFAAPDEARGSALAFIVVVAARSPAA